jgi:hypothetical protein
MSDVVSFLIVFCGICAAIMLADALIAHFNTKEINEIHAEVTKLLSTVIFMRLEVVGDTTFAYNAVTGDFVCQGTDLTELNVNFGARFPTSKGVIVAPEEQTDVL